MTQRITARKVECGNVRKIVARPEIEMIKKRGKVACFNRRSSIGRSLVRSPLEKGSGGNIRFMVIHCCRHILGLDNRFRTEKLAKLLRSFWEGRLAHLPNENGPLRS